jgi:hypothetical protein
LDLKRNLEVFFVVASVMGSVSRSSSWGSLAGGGGVLGTWLLRSSTMGEMKRTSGLIEDSICRLFDNNGSVVIAGSFYLLVPLKIVKLFI